MNMNLHSTPSGSFLKTLTRSCLIFIFFLLPVTLSARENSEHENKNEYQDNTEYDIIVKVDEDVILGGYTETRMNGDEQEFIGNIFLLRNHRKPILIKRQAGYMVSEIQNTSLSNGRLILIGFRSPHRAEHYLPVFFFVTAGRVPIFSELKFPGSNLPPILYAGKARLSKEEQPPAIQLFEALIHHNSAPPFVYAVQTFQFINGQLLKTESDPQFTEADSFLQYANIGTELFQLELYAQAVIPYLKAFQALRHEVYPITTELRSEIRLNLAICYLETNRKAQATVLLKAIIEGAKDSYYAKEAQKLLKNLQ
jgi:tetratricopeptide (TPR) repeat protein